MRLVRLWPVAVVAVCAIAIGAYLLMPSDSCKMVGFQDVVYVSRASSVPPNSQLCVIQRCSDVATDRPVWEGLMPSGQDVTVELRVGGSVVDSLAVTPISAPTPQPSCQGTYRRVGVAVDGNRLSAS